MALLLLLSRVLVSLVKCEVRDWEEGAMRRWSCTFLNYKAATPPHFVEQRSQTEDHEIDDELGWCIKVSLFGRT
jgi:hypothetical protein